MSQWVRKGLATGIKTTRYPAREEKAPGVSPGLPVGGEYSEAQARSLVDLCPTGALTLADHQVAVDYRRCVHCFRCRYGATAPIRWQEGYEWAAASIVAAGGTPAAKQRALGLAFNRSIHILVVDAGDCGACLNEVRQLNNPYYNMHRLGFFITPTPREADVLLVVGPVTDHMRVPLQKAFDAMPTPKRVIAVGACALSASVFGPSFVCGSGVRDMLRVDVEVPGQPPPPLAILHGLLVAVGRKPSASLVSPARNLNAEEAKAL
jgi:Ni,Fe-hydrogenase III small subunit/ferredoxin-like protein FixX